MNENSGCTQYKKLKTTTKKDPNQSKRKKLTFKYKIIKKNKQ